MITFQLTNHQVASYVDVEWQRNACKVMGLQFHGPNTVAPGGPDAAIKPPDACTVKHIRGDGNCLFRSFSYLITGSEDEHDAASAAIVSYMLTTGQFLVGFQIPTQCTVQGYVNDTHMDSEGSWGTEVEMLTLAHFLQTPVLVYNTEHGGIPLIIALDDDVTQMSMYLWHPPGHFEVVRSVRNSESCRHCLWGWHGCIVKCCHHTCPLILQILISIYEHWQWQQLLDWQQFTASAARNCISSCNRKVTITHVCLFATDCTQ